MANKKTVLFFPLNSPGHINSSLGIADRLKEDYGCRTIFLVLGSMIGNTIQEHGHELVTLEEVNAMEDYKISDEEDSSEFLDKKEVGHKVKFPGALKWPQMLRRYKHIFELDPVESFIRSMSFFEKVMVDELIENHDNYAAAIESIKPDLIIVDAYYIPPCIVGNKTIPWVRLYSANPLTITKSKLPGGIKPPPFSGYPLLTKEERNRLRKENPAKIEAILEEWKSATERIIDAMSRTGSAHNEFLAQHNCPPLEPGQQAHDSPYINFYMFPKALDYDKDDDIFEYSPRWFGCDSLVRKSFSQTNTMKTKYWEEKLVEGMKNKGEMIYFSMGSIASGDVKLMKKFIKFLDGDDKRLYVVSKGVNGDKFELNSSNMIGGNYIPQTFFLERANIAVVHGGNNSVTECLYYGLPMVIVPVFADQLDNAQRVQDLGLGRRVDPYTCTKEDFTHAIDCVLSDLKMIENAREVGKQMRKRDDPRKISLMIKKLLDDGDLGQTFIEDCRKKDASEIEI